MLAYVRWILRSGARFGHRLVVFLDSRVVIGAASKGRSSSRPLSIAIRQLAGFVLAEGWYCISLSFRQSINLGTIRLEVAPRRGRGSSDDSRQKMTTMIIVALMLSNKSKTWRPASRNCKNCGGSDFNPSEDSSVGSDLFDEDHPEDDENTSGVGSIDVYP